MTDITAIILTKNEEVNIVKCIGSLRGVADRICVVDSGSTDRTVALAEASGAEIFHHEPFNHYAAQFNWALDNVGVKTKWVYRIDADEVVTPELGAEIVEACAEHYDDDVNGLVMKFRIFFMGRFLTHGGIYPFYNLTIFKYGIGRYEDRAMGEHVMLSEGRTADLKNDCLHYDFKSLDAWINKHNWYATREVADYYSTRSAGQADAGGLYHEARKASRIRDGFYYRLPKFMRAKFYFWYRYYLKLGFLDGKAGYVHAFLQAYWYRFLVDAKIMEKEINNDTLWLVSELFPPDETSTSYIFGELANAFSGKYRVKVICGPDVYDRRKPLDPDSRFVLDPSIEVFRTGETALDKNTAIGKVLGFFLMSRRLMRLVRKHIKTGDRVLMATNPAPLILLMSRLKKRRGFELNLLVHDVFPENTIPAGLKVPMYGFFKNIFDKAYADVDQLVAIGRDMAEVLRGKAPGTKVTVIGNWADTDGIRPQPMPDGKIRIQYAGNIGRVQGLDKVIEQLPDDVELHIYGTGAMEDVLKKIQKQNVFFHGPYFRSRQNEVLADCHIALVTLHEGMYGLGVPSKTYNIMASGRPVLFLGPKGSEIDLLVREKGIGYSGWPQTWDVEELNEMGRRARKVAEEEYSKKAILDKFLKEI